MSGEWAISFQDRRHSARSHLHVRRLEPGGWGEKLVFGYMFRVAVAILAIVLPAVLLVAWGWVTGWARSNGVLWFYGICAALLTWFGEHLRSRVYERISPLPRQPEEAIAAPVPGIDDASPMAAPLPFRRRLIKRSFDLVASVIALVVLAPMMVIVATLVKFDSPGPVLFVQLRQGRAGKTIRLVKFRTMRVVPTAGAARGREVTRAGRFLRMTSIDELPQLFNVVTGSLSLVGPTPLPVGVSMDADDGREQLPIRPGLVPPPGTGWRVEDRGAGIRRYLETQSFGVDLRVLLRAVVGAIRNDLTL